MMKVEKFDASWLKKLWRPTDATGKFSGGQVTIVGGSSLFHGAPVLALKSASRIVSMVYFATPVADRGVAEKLKASLSSFIWIPFDEVNEYVAKSDSILVGPGMMRNRLEKDGFVCDEQGKETKEVTLSLFSAFPDKKFVVDGGSLQVINTAEIPPGSVITPNKKEFRMLFDEDLSLNQNERIEQLSAMARNHKLVILAKDVVSIATDGEKVVLIEGGNPGLIKGGTGDVLAGLTVGFLAKNKPLLAISAAQYLVKKAAESLANRVGLMYNADDLVDEVRLVYGENIS